MGFGITNDPNKTATIEEFISFKNDDTFSYHNMSFRDRYGNISYPIKNILDDYRDELMELVIDDVAMSETEYLKYRYRPRLLANDIYKNPDLDFLILYINGLCNMKEFELPNKTVKLIKMEDLTEFITAVFNANKDDIDLYNSEYDA